MKRIVFSRKAILRAIHAACVALFLAAAAQRADAQTFSPPFVQVSGAVYDTESGTYTTGGFNGATSPYTLTINSGTTLNTTSASYGTAVQFYNAKTNIAEGGGTFTNQGTVQETLTNPGNGYYSAVALYVTASGGATAFNTGTLSLSATGAIAAGLSFDNSNFGANTPAVTAQPFTLTNSGTISGTASGYGFGVHAKSAGTGNLTITNQQGGSIQGTSSANYAAGVWAHFAGGGALTVDNAGTISATGHTKSTGIDALTTTGGITITNDATGQLTLNNSTLNQQNFGINANSTSGGIDITNAGLISLTVNAPDAIAINAQTTSASDLQVANSGTITVSANASVEGGVNIRNEGTGNAVITNFSGGVVDVTSSGAGGTGLGAISATGTAIVTNNGTVQVGSTGSAYGIATTGGSTQVTNTGTIGATGTSGSSYGIYSAVAGDVTVANSNTIQATTTGGTASAIYLYTPTGTGTVTNSGALTATGSTDAYGIVANGFSGDTSTYNITNSATIQVSCTGSGGNLNSDGIFGDGQNVQITNSGAITATGTGSGTYVDAISASAVTAFISNTGVLSATSSGGGSYGIYAGTTSGTTVSNNQTIMSTSASGYANGIDAFTLNGDVEVTNSGSITASGGMATNGINAQSSGASVQVGNTGAIHATSTSATASAIYLYAPTGMGTVNNTGALTSMGANNAYGINAHGVAGNTQSYTITNSATILVSSTGSSGSNSAGIFGNSNQTLQITNSGAITATGSGSNTYVYAIFASGGTDSISNTGLLSATSSGGGSYGIYAGASVVTVSNNQTIASTSASGYASGIYARALGDVDVTNSGSLTVSGSKHTLGIAGISINSNVSLSNSGAITATASAYSASGLYATANGNIAITNSGHVAATSQSGAYTASGIYSQAGTGSTTINNSGYAGGFNTNGGLGYGIDVDPTGPIIVNNTGTAIGTTAGIFLANAGTVNNYGLASGGTYSIEVPTGSTVNLDGASPVLGLLKGGVNDTSTSQLNFDIAIDGNHLAADEAALNAAIAQYNTALTNAVHGAGHDVESEVVVLNGIDYQWEDFAGEADNLVQGRLYENTPSYHSMGTVLDNLPNNAASNTILDALNNVPDAGVGAALSELSPQQLQVFRNVAFDNNTFNVAKINNHLANRRDGATGFDASQLAVHDSSMDSTLDQVKSHLLAYNNPASSLGPISDSTQAMFGAVDMKDTKSTEVTTTPTDPWSTFIAGDVLLADLSNSTTQQNSNYTTGSVTAGLDYQLDEHFTVGALFSYSHTDATLDSRGSSATVDGYTPGLYASYVNKGWYANFLGAYSRNAYTSDRMIDITGLNGDNHGGTHGNQGSVNLTGGYEFQKGAFKFGPIASLQYVHLAIDSMQEQGPTALSIDSQDQDSLRSQLGMEGRFVADVNTPFGPMSLTPHLSASWQHEYMDSSGGITSQFTGTGGGSFVTQTQPPDRDAAFIDAGLDATVNNNVTVFVDYETQVGQQNYFAQSAQGGVKIGF